MKRFIIVQIIQASNQPNQHPVNSQKQSRIINLFCLLDISTEILIIIIKMEYGFASNGTNNGYFDRVAQMGVDTSINQITYCLESCKIGQRAYSDPRLSFQQKVCLQNCAKIMSLDIALDEGQR